MVDGGRVKQSWTLMEDQEPRSLGSPVCWGRVRAFAKSEVQLPHSLTGIVRDTFCLPNASPFPQRPRPRQPETPKASPHRGRFDRRGGERPACDPATTALD